MAAVAIPFRWTGEVMEPARGHLHRCNVEFVVGAVYTMETVEQRSAASHRHYFAAIHEAWQSLPENLVEQFPTDEHLRRWCLIRAGYCQHRDIVASSKAEALRISAFVKPMDPYAVVAPRGCVVTVWTAESQSTKAMGKQRFQESKDAVLGLIATMIGTDPVEIGRAA